MEEDEIYMDQEKQNEIEECFRMFDKDKDGYATFKELELIFRSLGYNYNEYELSELFSEYNEIKYNKKNEAIISFTLFEKVFKNNLKDTDLEEELYTAFNNFVKDDSGKISITEFKHLMNSLGDKFSEEIDEMAKDADPNQDGYVNCREFIKLLISK